MVRSGPVRPGPVRSSVQSGLTRHNVRVFWGEHRSKTGPDRDQVGPRLRTEDRTEMVRSGPGRSSSGPILHGIIFGFLVRSDRTDRTEDRIGPKPRTEDRTEIRSEDDVARISTLVYITNFPEATSAKELFQACNQYGHVVDSFIPNKKSKIGKRFGFVRFINVFSEERLISNLCTVWMDRFKIHANIARFQRPMVKKEGVGAKKPFFVPTPTDQTKNIGKQSDVKPMVKKEGVGAKKPFVVPTPTDQKKNIGKQSDVKSYKGVLNGIKNKEIEI
nr:nucleotide-binding alpha-beta plait domain-containing protein [Tanacetum cinerariifolium]